MMPYDHQPNEKNNANTKMNRMKEKMRSLKYETPASAWKWKKDEVSTWRSDYFWRCVRIRMCQRKEMLMERWKGCMVVDCWQKRGSDDVCWRSAIWFFLSSLLTVKYVMHFEENEWCRREITRVTPFFVSPGLECTWWFIVQSRPWMVEYELRELEKSKPM